MPYSSAEIRPSNPVLTEEVRRLANQPSAFIANQIAPALNRPNQRSGQLLVWGEGNLELPDDGIIREPGTESRVLNSESLGYVSYTTQPYAESEIINHSELAEYAAQGGNPLLLKQAPLARLLERLMIKKEYLLATKLTTAANFDTNHSTTVNVAWDNANADIIGDIETGILQMGMIAPTDLVIDDKTFVKMQRNSALMEYFKYVRDGALVEDIFSRLFPGLKLRIGRAYYKSSASADPTSIWGTNAILLRTDPSASPNDYQSNMTSVRTITSRQLVVKEISMPHLDIDGATKVEVQEDYSHEFIGIDNTTDKDLKAGYLMAGVRS